MAFVKGFGWCKVVSYRRLLVSVVEAVLVLYTILGKGVL